MYCQSEAGLHLEVTGKLIIMHIDSKSKPKKSGSVGMQHVQARTCKDSNLDVDGNGWRACRRLQCQQMGPGAPADGTLAASTWRAATDCPPMCVGHTEADDQQIAHHRNHTKPLTMPHLGMMMHEYNPHMQRSQRAVAVH